MNKKLMAIAAFAMASVIGTSMAAMETSAHQRHGSKTDANQDGLLSREEAKSHPFLSQRFDALDSNRDGQLSRDELRAARQARKAERQARLKQADANGDGSWSKQEAAAIPLMARHFDKLDTNRNGLVSQEELNAAHQGKQARWQERLKKADANGDGALSREEAKGLPRLLQRFDRLDTNRDGTLTPAEWSAGRKQPVQ